MFTLINLPTNYYGVAFSIARLRFLMGWEDQSGSDALLACRADHVRLNGIDLWRGGVHLSGSDCSPWRWDARDETLVS